MRGVSKGFLAAGWVPAAGVVLKALGSALAAFMFRPETVSRSAAAPLWRIRVGARKLILERRAHGTPTGRCSVGRWVREATHPTPDKARGWTAVGQWATAIVREYETAHGYSWVEDRGKHREFCRQSGNNPHHPTLSGGNGRGRKCRSNPATGDTFGFTPANGRRTGTHDAAKAARIVAREKRRAAQRKRNAEWLATQERMAALSGRIRRSK